jgi:hypothetical protein
VYAKKRPLPLFVFSVMATLLLLLLLLLMARWSIQCCGKSRLSESSDSERQQQSLEGRVSKK